LRGPFRLYPESSVHKELEAHRKFSAILAVDGDEHYPKALKSLDEAPPVLSFKGNPALCAKPSVAIVGARNCSLNGRKIAFQLAKELGQAGYVITSGLARGIDAQAHLGSLETGTIAVIAGGIDKIYPPEHIDLFAKIANQGLIIAESIFGTEPQSALFPRRNRLISGISQGVIIIEAAFQSGSLITARYAAEQNRDVFVVPGSPLDPRYRGSNNLIRSGATLITRAQDVLEALKEPYYQKMKKAAAELEEEQDNEFSPQDIEVFEESEKTIEKLSAEILIHLSSAPISLDEVLRACSYSSSLVMSVVLELELAGKVTRHPGNKLST
jgi:DNA processing protein